MLNNVVESPCVHLQGEQVLESWSCQDFHYGTSFTPGECLATITRLWVAIHMEHLLWWFE